MSIIVSFKTISALVEDLFFMARMLMPCQTFKTAILPETMLK